jgi:hypothetical protein
MSAVFHACSCIQGYIDLTSHKHHSQYDKLLEGQSRGDQQQGFGVSYTVGKSIRICHNAFHDVIR